MVSPTQRENSMSVVLTDEEFTIIYQALSLSQHPNGQILLAMLTVDEAITAIDAVPDSDRLRVQAMRQLPELASRLLPPPVEEP